MRSRNLIKLEILRDVNVSIILNIEQDDMIIVDHLLSILSVLVSWLEIKSNSLRGRNFHELNFLTGSINMRDSLCVLDKVARVNMHQLNRHPIVDPLAKHFIDQLLVVFILVNESSLQCFHPFGLVINLLNGLFLKPHRRVLLLLLDDFVLSPQLFHGVITQFRDKLKLHVSHVLNMRAMQLGA